MSIFNRSLDPRHSREPLKAMFVITSMPVGGAETLLVNMMDRFDPQRIVPEVCCLKAPGPLGEEIQDRYAVHSGLIKSKYDVLVAAKLASLFQARRADAVITVGAGDKMFWGRIAARLARVPVVASALHSTGWPDGVGRLNRLLTPITDGFIGVADSHADYLRDVEKFPSSKVFTIRNGVDTKRFCSDNSDDGVRAEFAIPQDAPLGIIVAALRPEKNHEMFVQVAAKVREAVPKSHFLIVGDGPCRGDIQAHCDELGAGGFIHFAGNRSDTDRLLSSSNVFILCSHNEASPVSILEALSCGIPVVSTNVGSIHETVKNGESGFLVPPGDQSAMAQFVAGLFQDPSLASRFGAEGRQIVVESGSLDAMVAGYTSLIERFYDQRIAVAGSPVPMWLARCTGLKTGQPLR